MFCASCGEQKRLRYPKLSPTCCSQKCAAYAFISYQEAGPWEASYCNKCGEPTNYHLFTDGEMICDKDIPDEYKDDNEEGC